MSHAGETFTHWIEIEEISATAITFRGARRPAYRIGYRASCRCGWKSATGEIWDDAISAGKDHKSGSPQAAAITAQDHGDPPECDHRYTGGDPRCVICGTVAAPAPEPPCQHPNCQTVRRVQGNPSLPCHMRCNACGQPHYDQADYDSCAERAGIPAGWH